MTEDKDDDGIYSDQLTEDERTEIEAKNDAIVSGALAKAMDRSRWNMRGVGLYECTIAGLPCGETTDYSPMIAYTHFAKIAAIRGIKVQLSGAVGMGVRATINGVIYYGVLDEHGNAALTPITSP